MNHKYALLVATIVPVLLLLANPGVAAPDSAIVVAQAQPNPPPNSDKTKKNPPAAAKTPAPTAPALVKKPAPPAPATAKPATPPAQRQIKPVQVVPPVTPKVAPVKPVQVQPAKPPKGQPVVTQPTPKVTPVKPVQVQPVTPPKGQPVVTQPNPKVTPVKPVQVQPVTPPKGQPVVTQPTPKVTPVKPVQKPVQVQPITPPKGQPVVKQTTPQVAPAPGAKPATVHKLDDFRGQRHETKQGNSVIIKEPGRTIVRDGGRLVIQHNESSDRFRLNARNVQTERRGANLATIIVRPNGSRIITLTDGNGHLLRRSRRDANGREFVLIDNTLRGGAVVVGAAGVAGLVILNMRPPVIHIPANRYIVEAEGADRVLIYQTLMAPPVEVIDRGYSLDEIRYNVALRDYMPRIDIDTITFDFGSWEVTPDQAQRLQAIAAGIKQALAANPNEVFLIEGHTDAIGTDLDNLSLSDRRAESVAQVLTETFGIEPENLTTQGYGEQFLKIPTQQAERRNRRVTIRRITPLLNGPVAQNR